MQGKYRIIESAAEQYPITELCSILGVSRSGYYRFLSKQGVDKDQETKERIKAIYEQRNGTYGYRRIVMELERQFDEKANHKRVLRLMQVLGLKAVIRRRRNYRSTYQAAEAAGRVAENLLQRDFKADKPNQKWVTDVTQYRVGDERLYLSAIKDLCSNDIVAYHISKRNDNELVLETFKAAFETQKDVTDKIAGLIVHSDQGFQYTSHAYHDMLPTVGAQISMSRRGNCLDNAAMESFFSHLKAEALYPYDIRSLDEAQRRIEEFIHFYNHERIQKKLNKLTPLEFRRQLAS
ncbi:IS3 family transposase [Paenibacillus sp. GD4]|uniref:IS3 family transposase n=1 Tax=Paenibacillus sp. GD4 TaxID=3068890 RepID=UPI002796D16D|nr:IS3 family transposase [Paenibacillus sp. GD4]MDQ1909248.1 IS3 family transposase [Paenibacillus sp. GD4]MDQ1909764.1 IS3 family transposase [Paenibacillus sp. GD4]MDQ1910763.1 IS3 family transposase [Paenibacillus sp. GD4]MDQ1914587.1 IS3 family transposase [Paenibacillus sp. GD4]